MLTSIQAQLSDQLQSLQKAQAADPMPTAADRIDRLKRLETGLLNYEDMLVEAMSEDFSYRAPGESRNFDITGTVAAIRTARRHVKKWMKRRRVGTPLYLLPARAHIQPQPKGVVGVVSPWNFPIFLSLIPIAEAFGAGNRVMLKPSELTPRTSQVLTEMLTKNFRPDELIVVGGDASVGAAFVSLPFDHIIYTGSTAVGRKVAEAAAKNLVPTTLELGGKCPVVIGEHGDMKRAVERLVYSKYLNAGQICIAPDYALVPENRKEELIAAVVAKIDEFYGDYNACPAYSAIINDRHVGRIEDLIKAAEDSGAKVIQAKTSSASNARKIPPTVIVDPALDTAVMSEEIFGPVLPILTYKNREDAQRIIAHNPNPLALYVFTQKREERDYWLKNSKSGGACVNETLFHVITDTLPFGGVGGSGQGTYHGRAGFDEFSHLKSVFVQPKLNGMFLFNPPHGPFKHLVGRIFRKLV